jgi:ferredoxin-type protein NapH
MVRKLVQFAATLAQNAYLAFPWTQNIYQGELKRFCTPGLNCHSCPAATLACPIGTLQLFVAGARSALEYGTYQLGLSVIGFLMAVGLLFGRLACGWLCPFGLLQELLHKLPSVKKSLWQPLTHLRYPVFFILVLALPFFTANVMGGGSPWFCKVLCPAGTLEASGLFFIMPELREQLGAIFYWKGALALFFLGWFVVSYRPFCRTVCPLGLIYGWFNRASLVTVRHSPATCEECGECITNCNMEVDPREAYRDSQCIRCFDCVTKHCPTGALKITVGEKELSFFSRSGRQPDPRSVEQG